MTPFRAYRFHSTRLCSYRNRKNGLTGEQLAVGPGCRYGLTVRKYWDQSNVFRTYGRVSRGLFPRVPRYGLLYLGTVEYDQSETHLTCTAQCWIIYLYFIFNRFPKQLSTNVIQRQWLTILGAKTTLHFSRSCNCNLTTTVTLESLLQWRHNAHDGVSNHQPYDCLLNGLFRCRSKKTSKLRVTGLCVGKSPVTG